MLFAIIQISVANLDLNSTSWSKKYLTTTGLEAHAATTCNFQRSQKQKNHSNRGFHEVPSIVTSRFSRREASWRGLLEGVLRRRASQRGLREGLLVSRRGASRRGASRFSQKGLREGRLLVSRKGVSRKGGIWEGGLLVSRQGGLGEWRLREGFEKGASWRGSHVSQLVSQLVSELVG